MRDHSGFSLLEIMIATAIMGVVALAASNVYIAAARRAADSQENVKQAGGFIAFEHIARRVALATAINVTGKQLNIRWDFDTADPPTPNGGTGTSDISDDTWVSYLIDADGKLYMARNAAADTAPAVDPSSDPELQPNLILNPAASFFTYPATNDRTVTISLTAVVGNPTREVQIIREVSSYALSAA